MTLNKDFWSEKKVLVTGHTGFKGSWLCIWLEALGARVIGYSLLPPTNPSLYQVAELSGRFPEYLADICNVHSLHEAVENEKPDIVFHLAAQPLVRLSYQDPLGTYRTNVMGTATLLDQVRQQSSVRAVINITTDKCYDNREWVWGYRENDRLGGHDPYSNSKACAELVVDSFRRSFFCHEDAAGIATVRAGNVIGGGDWAADRLVPDCLRAFEQGQVVSIRNPHAIRPWQHVLEPLCGYLMLAEQMFNNKATWDSAWNFGPTDEDCLSVGTVVGKLAELWGADVHMSVDTALNPHEAGILKLDCSKAKNQLGWKPRLHIAEALQATVAWHKAWLAGHDMQQMCLNQILDYELKG